MRTILFSCFAFVLLSQNKLNLTWMFSFWKKKKKKEKQGGSLWGVIFSFTNPKQLTEEFWFLLSVNPLGLDLAVLLIID